MTKKITLDSRELEELLDTATLTTSIGNLIDTMEACRDFRDPTLNEAFQKLRKTVEEAVEPILDFAEAFESRFTEEEETDD